MDNNTLFSRRTPVYLGVVLTLAVGLMACETPVPGRTPPNGSPRTSFVIIPTTTPRPDATEEPTPTITPVPAPADMSGGPTGPTTEAQLVTVEDGDTIIVSINGVNTEVRYLGVDAPEGIDEPFAPGAQQTNATLLGAGPLTLEKDVTDVDEVNRAVRYVWVRNGDAWVNVSVELVRLGFAEAQSVAPDTKYDGNIWAAQQEAQAAGLGIWGQPPPPPTLAPGQTPTPVPTEEPAPSGTPVPAPTDMSAGPTGPTVEAQVVEVSDGDTIVVSINGVNAEVRYVGLDAPEGAGEPFAAEAQQANATLLGAGPLTLETDVSDVDSINRQLRYVWVRNGEAWVNVNLELVRMGLAEADSVPPDVKYDGNIWAAQLEAQAARVGIWGDPPATPIRTATPTPPAASTPFTLP